MELNTFDTYTFALISGLISIYLGKMLTSLMNEHEKKTLSLKSGRVFERELFKSRSSPLLEVGKQRLGNYLAERYKFLLSFFKPVGNTFSLSYVQGRKDSEVKIFRVLPPKLTFKSLAKWSNPDVLWILCCWLDLNFRLWKVCLWTTGNSANETSFYDFD